MSENTEPVQTSILSGQGEVEPTIEEKVSAIDAKPAFDWRDQLSEDFRQDPSLNSFKDLNDLAKSYVNTKKMVGMDKVAIPGKYATDDEWRTVFHKLGLPEEVSKYELKPVEGDVSDELFASFKETAYKSGVLPKQAQSIYDWFQKASEDLQAKAEFQSQKIVEENINELKKEWGENFNKNLQVAKAAVKHFGGNELQEYLDQSGLGNDAKVIKLMAKVGEVLTEDQFKGVTEAMGGMHPRDIESRKAAIYGDPAYFDRNHPGHDSLVNEMLRLNKLLMDR